MTIIEWLVFIGGLVAAEAIVFLAGYRYAERHRLFGDACDKCVRDYKEKR